MAQTSLVNSDSTVEEQQGVTPPSSLPVITDNESASPVITGDTPTPSSAAPEPASASPGEDATPLIRVEPSPTANVPTDVDISTGPPFVTFKSLQPEVDAAIDRAAPSDEPQTTFEDFFQNLKNGGTAVLDGPDGEKVYTERSAILANQSGSYSRKLRLAYEVDKSKKEKVAAQTPAYVPEAPTIAFVKSTGEIDVGGVDPSSQSSARIYAEGRKALDDAIKPYINTGRPDIDLVVRQYFVDDFEAGDSVANFSYRFSETRRFFQNTVSAYAPVLGGGALEAVYRAETLGTSFSEEWDALLPKREAAIQTIFDRADEGGFSPSAAMYFNDMIQERVEADPSLSEEQKDYLLFETTMGGQKVERTLVNNEMAMSIINESFRQMNRIEQWGVIFAENLFGGGVFGKAKIARTEKQKANVLKFKKENGLENFDISIDNLLVLAEQQGKKLNHNRKLYNLGLYSDEVKAQSQQAGVRIEEINKEIDRLEGLPKVNRTEIGLLQSEAKNLVRLRRRNFIRTTISPYLLEIIAPEATIAGAAVAGRSLSGAFGMDEDTGELVGLVTGLAGELTGVSRFGRGLAGGIASRTVGAVGGLASRVSPDGTVNVMSGIYSKLTNADMTVQDYERLIFIPRNGRPMRRNELKMLSAAFKQVQKMDPDTQEDFISKIQEGVQLQDDLISMFPDDIRRIEAAASLDGALAETAGIPRLMNAYEMSVENMLSKDLKKNGLMGATEALQATDERLNRATLLLDNFAERLADVDGFANPNEMLNAQQFIQNTRKSISDMQAQLMQESEKLALDLDDMLKIAVEDVSTPLDPEFFDVWSAAKESLKSRLGADNPNIMNATAQVAELQSIQTMSSVVNESLIRRFELVQARKDFTDVANLDLESSVEALVFARYETLSTEMDAVYTNFRKFVAENPRPKIDISPAVEEMLRLANADQANITTFFGPTSTFFAGYLGKKSMKMFERMTMRTLDSLPENQRAELFNELVEEGVDPADLQELVDKNPVQFGLLLHQNGKLNVFANANIEEAEEFRKAFRDYGHKTSNPAVSREFKNFEKLIDGIMDEGDPEGFAVLSDARQQYTQLNDPSRPGSVMNRILKSKVGNKQTPDGSGLSGMYQNKTPFEIVGEMGNTIANIMSGQRTTADMSKLKKQVAGFSQLFGTVGTDNKMRIDLRTEEGRIQMQLMEEVIGAIVYNQWAGDFLKRGPRVGTRYPDPRTIGFERTIQDKLEGINVVFDIDVIDANGNNTVASVFNITDMLSAEKDISKLIEEGGEYHDLGVKTVRKLNSSLKRAASDNKIAAEKEQAGAEILKGIVNIKGQGDSAKFYEEYITGFGDIDALREQWIINARRNDNLKGLNDDELNVMFNQATFELTYKALLQAGEYGTVGVRTAARVRGNKASGLVEDKMLISGLASAEGFLAELENPKVVEGLKRMGMPDAQIENLTNIGRYLTRQQAKKVSSDLIDRGMSAESALSRAYNIARGQVGITYVTSEVALRLLRKNNSDALLLAIQSPDAARIMSKMLDYPKLVTAEELKTFDTLLQGFLFMEISRKGNEKMMTDYFNYYTGDEQPPTEGETNDE